MPVVTDQPSARSALAARRASPERLVELSTDTAAARSTPPDVAVVVLLVGTEVVENKILASRLVLRVLDKVSTELDDVRLRIRHLDDFPDLDRHDIDRKSVV